MTRRELEEMVQGLVDGHLDEQEFGRLQEELRSDPQSREFFRKSMEVETLLTEAMGQRVDIRGAKGGMDQMLLRRRKRDVTRSALATAAILTIAAVVMTFIMVKRSNPPGLVCDLVPGTQWEVTGGSRDPGADQLKVTEGSTVRVLSGTVKMEMESGAVMVMRGPAEVAFPKLQEPVLKKGWLWIDSADGAETFTLKTPDLIVRNLGTRFGVRVPEDGPSEIYLVKGTLEVERTNEEGEVISLEPKDTGFFVDQEGGLKVVPLSPDPFPNLPELLAAPLDYRTAVLSQGPAGYWKLDSLEGKILENEVTGGLAGYRGNEAFQGQPGIGSEGRFDGFSDENHAIRLTGDPLTSVITKIDIPGGISRKEGGVSFWIRRELGSNEEEILWLAGKTPDDAAISPKEAIMHARLASSGKVEFFIENGKFDILLSSNFSVVDNQWHHIAAGWGPSAVELYVDGKRVGRVDDFGSLKPGVMHGEYVRFGKPSSELAREGKHSFSGWVDEIAIWNRPLVSAEIAQQFKAARSVPKDRKASKPEMDTREGP
ncbi:MAG: hypothetical protein P8P32_06845 [Akkermansiaceae bacterium]|nr:hypothetical protein [Akkermansiaceae bacterium]MDG2324150.1 hypothetical protein [Akkermansiaceae bacterium]